jgi:tRNA (mo5U34)-methyltransferase
VDAREIVNTYKHWYHKFEIAPGVITPGVYDPSNLLSYMQFPDDMRGKRILEIGPSDGFFTKAFDSRGAEVIAVDYVPKEHTGFAIMERLYGKNLVFINCNVFDLPKLALGKFDFVTCLGVLYHLPDMLRALWILKDYVGGQLLLETFISTERSDRPMAEYLPSDSCNNDATNFWAPNAACVEFMLEDCGYSVVEMETFGTRAFYRCELSSEHDAGFKMSHAYKSLKKSRDKDI